MYLWCKEMLRWVCCNFIGNCFVLCRHGLGCLGCLPQRRFTCRRLVRAAEEAKCLIRCCRSVNAAGVLAAWRACFKKMSHPKATCRALQSRKNLFNGWGFCLSSIRCNRRKRTIGLTGFVGWSYAIIHRDPTCRFQLPAVGGSNRDERSLLP